MNIRLVMFALAISFALVLSGCTEKPNPPTPSGGTGIPPEGNDEPGSGKVSARFADNGYRSIYDSKLSVNWLKCVVGSQDANCCELEQSAPECVGKLYNVRTTDFRAGASQDTQNPSSYMCISDDSAEAQCANGVLCNDGTFAVVDWRNDWQVNPGNWKPENMPPNWTVPSAQNFTMCQYYRVPDKSKELACKDHGGISLKGWRVPELSEISSLYDKAQSTGIDARFFPHTKGAYASTGASDPSPGIPAAGAYNRKAVHFPDGRIVDESSVKVRCVTDETLGSGKPVAVKPSQCNAPEHQLVEYVIYDTDGRTNTCSTTPNNSGTSETWSKETGNARLFKSEVTSTGKDATVSITTIQISDKTTGDATVYTKDELLSPQFRRYKYSADSEAMKQIAETEAALDSLRNPDCSCKFNDVLYSGKKDTINGLECHYLRNPIKTEIDTVKGTGYKTTTVYDCINLDFCMPLLAKVYAGQCLLTDSKVKPIAGKFPDLIFDPPKEYIDQEQAQKSQGTDNDSQFSECVKKCDEMQGICTAKNQTVNSDASGCYDTSGPKSGYERSCYSTCVLGNK